MQCPVCHSDTTPSLPRCTRCNARLDEATVRDAAVPSPWPAQWPEQTRNDAGSPGEEPASPPSDPWHGPQPSSWTQAWGDSSSPPGEQAASPPSDPWHGPQPSAWAHEGGASGPSGEETTSLSPEPWDAPQSWGQMWEPPPPRRRSKALPYVLTGLGVWILTMVALAIIFWPHGDDSTGTLPQQSATSVEQPTDDPGAGTPEPSAPDDDAEARQQATQIDALLGDMASTRSELGAVVSAGCDTSDLERIRDQRQEQLSTAETLQVDALPDGEALKSALTGALRISVESNQLYLQYAPGCPSDEDAADVNDRATRAKSEVIGLWNAIAAEYGLSPRDSGSI
ncbi:hypothetical protein SAMN04489712_118126 [Thermomonospora echinospora]|uniref:Uncharacterized protein n=1 Tax=Thermomonospora echinospora TaxID=1992 RepID=A0A1H6DMR7_9ACTN|nr:hypothetical protein [Thermomonospora echinospora]SEG85996.1 hypothetical protein SAMN04489712_118126 [Thermomonospora echinospora]